MLLENGQRVTNSSNTEKVVSSSPGVLIMKRLDLSRASEETKTSN